jgi:hypothetical protein
LPTFSVIVKDDIVLEEGVAYTVALIKDTLKNLKVQVEEEDEETVEVDDSNLLKVSKITDDESNKVLFLFNRRLLSILSTFMELKRMKLLKQSASASILAAQKVEDLFYTLNVKAAMFFTLRRFLTNLKTVSLMQLKHERETYAVI